MIKNFFQRIIKKLYEQPTIKKYLKLAKIHYIFLVG
jgi:hypothetical protein